MAAGLCISCMAMKSGTVSKCERCGFQPITAMDAAASNKLSEHCFSAADLRGEAEELRILNGFKDEYVFFNNDFFLDRVLIGFLKNAIEEPLLKYLLVLRRDAKQGFLRNEVNVHHLGDDGYSYSIMPAKEVPGAKEFLNLGKHAFALTASNGQGFLVEDKRWCVLYDQHVMLGRRTNPNIGLVVKCMDIFYSTVVEILAPNWGTIGVEQTVAMATADEKFSRS